MASQRISHRAIRSLLGTLEGQRNSFANALSSEVENYVSAKSTSECLSLVCRNRDGSIRARYSAEMTPRFLETLFKFCCKLDHHGYKLDSALTDEIVKIFERRYFDFLRKNNDKIIETVQEVLVDTAEFKEAIRQGIAKNESVKFLDKQVKKALADTVVTLVSEGAQGVAGGIQDQALAVKTSIATAVAGSATATAVSGAAAKTITYVLSTHVAHVAAQKILIIVSQKLSILIAKAMAVPAVKAAVVAAAKKAVVAVMVASFLKVFAAKLAIGPAGIAALVVPPVVLWYFYRQWNTFPEKLGKGIAAKLSEDSYTTLRDANEAMIANVLDYIFGKGISEIEAGIAGVDLSQQVGVARKLIAANRT